MKTLFQIEIPKRGHVCAKGQESLTPGMTYFSILSLDEEQGMVRQDFCLECWNHSVREETLKAGKTHWKSKVVQKKREPITAQNRDERILELLKESLSRGTEDDWQESFVLSLFLARRRMIMLRQEVSQEDGSQALLYEVADTEEMLCVRKVALSVLQIEKIQQEIAKKLKE